LLSGTLALSKVRREVMHFADALTLHLKAKGLTISMKRHRIDSGVVRDEREVVPHADVLAAAIGPKDAAKQFCAPFYDDVRLTQWFFRFRRLLASQDGATTVASLAKKVPKLIEDSRQRTRWQILRLYRARNHLAHGGSRPLWLSDLLRHADYFLTNAVAICLNYANSPTLTAREILTKRCAWLDAYVSLAEEGEPKALSVAGMLYPSKLFKV
jgi:hypothetical protein